jgi:cob(I)alamin adenosyltransferase
VKIYTRTGDAGDTGLLGEGRVRKNALRIEACGAVDELNAALGVAAAAPQDADLCDLLHGLQRDLLAIGAQLGDVRTDSGNFPQKMQLGPDHVTALERAIDKSEAELAPLQSFLLPGGCEGGARLHLARTVCRRAERRVVALTEHEAVPPLILAYLNRLSDLLFVLARVANRRARTPEIPW